MTTLFTDYKAPGTSWCGSCGCFHGTEVTHCTVCTVALIRTVEVASGFHAECERMRAAQAALESRMGTCVRCERRSSTLRDELCQWCRMKDSDAAEAAWLAAPVQPTEEATK